MVQHLGHGDNLRFGINRNPFYVNFLVNSVNLDDSIVEVPTIGAIHPAQTSSTKNPILAFYWYTNNARNMILNTEYAESARTDQ